MSENTTKFITIDQLEEVMNQNINRKFDADSIDTYGFSINMLCNKAHFDKAMDGSEYLSIILANEAGAEVQIDPEIINSIQLDNDGLIVLEFTNGLPDLEIKYRD